MNKNISTFLVVCFVAIANGLLVGPEFTLTFIFGAFLHSFLIELL